VRLANRINWKCGMSSRTWLLAASELSRSSKSIKEQGATVSAICYRRKPIFVGLPLCPGCTSRAEGDRTPDLLLAKEG
jgi:hypothetical protein